MYTQAGVIQPERKHDDGCVGPSLDFLLDLGPVKQSWVPVVAGPFGPLATLRPGTGVVESAQEPARNSQDLDDTSVLDEHPSPANDPPLGPSDDNSDSDKKYDENSRTGTFARVCRVKHAAYCCRSALSHHFR